MKSTEQEAKILQDREDIVEKVTFFNGKNIILSEKDIDFERLKRIFNSGRPEDILELKSFLDNSPVAYNYGKIIHLDKRDLDIEILDQNESFQKIVGFENRSVKGTRYSQTFGNNRYIGFLMNKIAEVAFADKSENKTALVYLNRKLYEICLYSPRRGYFVSFLVEFKDNDISIYEDRQTDVIKNMLLECHLSKAIILNIRLPFYGLKSVTMISSYKIAEQIGLLDTYKDYSEMLIVSSLEGLEADFKDIKGKKAIKVYTLLDI